MRIEPSHSGPPSCVSTVPIDSSKPEGKAREVVANDPELIAAEVSSLTWRVLDGVASPEELSRLDHLIAEQSEARQFFVDSMALDSSLHELFAAK